VRATFFVLGDVMQHHPALIQAIHAEGHEIGCHGWSHRPLWSLDAERWALELETFDREAGALLPVEEIVGFRAPTFSLDARCPWALSLLEERGYRYDSSIFPLRTPLYGHADAPLAPYRLAPAALTTDHPMRAGLVEFPLSVVRGAGVTIPVAGGVYLRMLPQFVWLGLLRQINQQGRPFVIYLHPWEADTGTPRVPGLGALGRLATYYGLGGTLHKLEALLRSFRLAPLRQVLGVPAFRQAPQKGPA
jgi:polysaccharide deacetylase family protein (PEP-CTERM system associated)